MPSDAAAPPPEGPSDVTKRDLLASDVTKSDILTSNVTKGDILTSNVTKGDILTSDVTKSAVLTSDVTKSAVLTSDVTKSAVLTSDAIESGCKRSDVLSSGVTKNEVVTSRVTKGDVHTSAVIKNDVLTSGDNESGVNESDGLTNGIGEARAPSNESARKDTPRGAAVNDVVMRRYVRSESLSVDGMPSESAVSDTKTGSSHAAPPNDALREHASRHESRRQSLLEPSALLMAIVRPFLGLRSTLIRFANLPTPSMPSTASEVTALEDERPTIVERSFANEVAALLRAQMRDAPDAPADRPVPIEIPAGNRAQRDEFAEMRHEMNRNASFKTPSYRDEGSSAQAKSDSLLHDFARPGTSGKAATEIFGASETQTAADDGRSVPGIEIPEPHAEWRDSEKPPSDCPGTLEAASGSDLSRSSESGKFAGAPNFGIPSDATTARNIVVAPNPIRREHAVPITRLPLRPQVEITWPAAVPELEDAGSLSRATRHQWLERFVRHPGAVSSDAISQAYYEEEGQGRTTALRVLLRNFPGAGRYAFIEALRVGSDEERALAIDGLAAIGARDEMTPALCDRVDAIAAKAALAYVGTLERADFRTQLAPFVDEPQIEAILKLLAGIVE